MNRVRAVWCALFGHTRAVTNCMGYQSCARCDQQVGDTLGGVGAHNAVGVDCGCLECEEGWRAAKWHERVLLRKPLKFTGLTAEETRAKARVERDRAIAALQADGERRRAADRMRAK